MQIYFINNVGAGFADRIEVEPGTTVSQLFRQKLPDADPADYLVRVDRQPVAADEPLRDGCRVSVTPTKIEGAWRADRGLHRPGAVRPRRPERHAI